jgi:hypothetical protein
LQLDSTIVAADVGNKLVTNEDFTIEDGSGVGRANDFSNKVASGHAKNNDSQSNNIGSGQICDASGQICDATGQICDVSSVSHKLLTNKHINNIFASVSHKLVTNKHIDKVDSGHISNKVASGQKNLLTPMKNNHGPELAQSPPIQGLNSHASHILQVKQEQMHNKSIMSLDSKRSKWDGSQHIIHSSSFFKNAARTDGKVISVSKKLMGNLGLAVFDRSCRPSAHQVPGGHLILYDR